MKETSISFPVSHSSTSSHQHHLSSFKAMTSCWSTGQVREIRHENIDSLAFLNEMSWLVHYDSKQRIKTQFSRLMTYICWVAIVSSEPSSKYSFQLLWK